MSRRVVITGLGVVSSIGIGWQEFWNNLLNGKSGISPVSSIDTSAHFTHKGGEIKDFLPEEFVSEEAVKEYSRATLLAVVAAKQALSDAGFEIPLSEDTPVGICYGTTTGPIQVIEEINNIYLRDKDFPPHLFFQLPPHTTVSAISKELGLRGPAFVLSTACAAGNYAIGSGYDLIQMQKAKMVVCCASDAFSRISFTGFNQFKAVAPEKCQPFDKNRKGMMVAEGAGALVLEDLKNAMRRGAEVYAEIIGYGLSCDARHMTSPSVDGIVACMRKALKDAGISPEEVDYISAHGTGTLANDRTECAAIKEVFGRHYKEIPISSIKSMLGHTMGAASALEAVACTLTVKNDIIPPTINYETPDPECDIDCVPNTPRRHIVYIALNNSYAFGGNNASVVFKKFIN
jgi:3-oxoacyl-[acyl-carrier-protein] synthase II